MLSPSPYPCHLLMLHLVLLVGVTLVHLIPAILVCGSQIGPRYLCQICKKSGHEAFNCFQRLNLQEFPVNIPKAVATLRASATGKSTFTASADSPSDIVDPWYVDSGTSHHVTTDLGNLNLHTNYEEHAGADTPKRNR